MLCVSTVGASEADAQIAVELSYGLERNVESIQPEGDGWMNLTVEWRRPSGFGFGIGTDHQFETAAISASDYQALAIYGFASFERLFGSAAPFARAGAGLGRAPCVGDTCGGGIYLRGSTGVRLRLMEVLWAVGEVGVTRVSRPFGGVGLSIRP